MIGWLRYSKTSSDWCYFLKDFSKAFDVMPHDILLNKLSSLYNITEDVWRWLRSFIYRRQQRVQYQGHYSDWSTTTSGIPQGSVLGPLLFNIFINELPACFNSSCALFADDTVLYRPLFSPSDHVTLQNDLDIMAQWCMDNNMKLNPAKTKVMRFTCSKNPACPVYNLYPVALQVVDEIKYRIILNNRLTWDSHVRYVTLRSNRMLGLISIMATGLSMNALFCLYKSLVLPILEYDLPVWNLHTQKLADLERIQMRASRIVLKQRRMEMSYTPTDCNFLTPSLREYKRFCCTP